MAVLNSGVRRLAVANGPNIFQMLLFSSLIFREKAMLKTDVNTFIGDFGVYQLRVFVVIVCFIVVMSMDSIQIMFIGGDMAHWCRVPELDDLPYDVQKNVAIPAAAQSTVVDGRDGSVEYSSCEMFSLNYSVYNRSQFYSWNRSSMITNHTSLVRCSHWTYDHSQFISTIVSKVRCAQLWTDARSMRLWYVFYLSSLYRLWSIFGL